MLVSSKELLLKAKKGNYAIGAFNVENMEMVKAVIKAANELSSPVIIQTTPSTIKYASAKMFSAMVKAEAEKVKIPVCLHLDHGNSVELVDECIKMGYQSVMIDASKFEYEKNIEIVKEAVLLARIGMVQIEAELGKVGGKEDDLIAEGNGNTIPSEAVDFCERTGIDSLAVAIGTAHGVYIGEPNLDLERLSEIEKVLDLPLVLHGASGLSDWQIKECVRRGISKVNFATELRIAYTNAVRKLLSEDSSIIDPKKLGEVGMKSVCEIVKSRIEVCGSAGKASV